MGHLTPKSYFDLQKRLDDSVQNAPYSDSFIRILEYMFTEEEAKQISKLPLKFFTIDSAIKIFNLPKKEVNKILNNLIRKGFLVDFVNKDTKAYFVTPPIPGFFEFAMMRTKGVFDKKVLAPLFNEYVNKEDELAFSLIHNEPLYGRVFPQTEAINTEILDYEKVKKIVESSSSFAVGNCYCRHINEHLGKPCNYPSEVCLSFNFVADSLIRSKIAKKISKTKALSIIERSKRLGLVQIGDNFQNKINVICNCCSCCCEVLNAYTRFGYTGNLTSNFEICAGSNCIGCGICVKKCPVKALSVKNKKIVVDSDKCIGCGVCHRFCPKDNLKLIRKEKQNTIPEDMFERTVLQALYEGKIQNYLFDNYTSISHKILRKFLGVILSLKPSKFVLANRYLQSTFLELARKTENYKLFNKLYYEK